MRALPLWVSSALPAGRQGKVAAAAVRPRNDDGGMGRWGGRDSSRIPDFAALHPGYACYLEPKTRPTVRTTRPTRGATPPSP